jgi:cholesterol oxidase
VDLNYLFVAEHRYGARILTEHLAERIVPLNAAGQDDAGADGGNGYRVHYRDLNGGQETSASARRVVVSAGTLGSNELLLRCRDVFKTLPGLNDNLGTRFSGNGDFLSFVVEGDQPADPNYGPVITQRTDFNLFSDFDRRRAFLLEDASYPAFAAWMVEGIRPSVSHLAAIWKAIKDGLRRLLSGSSMERIGFAMGDILGGDMSYSTSVLLCMGLDNAKGVARLNAAGYLEIDWPRRENMPLYEAILDAGERFRHQVGAKAFVPMPNWWWPFRQNITVHPLGGCRLADNPAEGLTSAQPQEMGQVFGYKGLYVADGSIVPTALGANPIATISALCERVAEGITGSKPDSAL